MFSFSKHGPFKGNQASYKNTKIPLAHPYKSTIFFLNGQYISYLEISPNDTSLYIRLRCRNQCTIRREISISKRLVKYLKIKKNVSNLNALQYKYIWVKGFMINPEFRTLRLTFHRKSASKCWIRQIIIASLIIFSDCLNTINHLSLTLFVTLGILQVLKFEFLMFDNKIESWKCSFLVEKSYNKTVIDFNFGRHKDSATLISDIHLGLEASLIYHFFG